MDLILWLSSLDWNVVLLYGTVALVAAFIAAVIVGGWELYRGFKTPSRHTRR